MKAAAAVIADTGAGGVTRFPVLRSQAPLVLRRTADAVYLVGGAAGPLGGDTLSLRIEVRPGATLRLRANAASVALPGPDGRASVLDVTATIAEGGRLEFLPEPTIVAAGARHRIELRVRLDDGAALVLRDELILGRHGERGGSCLTRLRADLGGAPLLRHELGVSGTDDVSPGPAVLAGHRAAGSLLRVEPSWFSLPGGQFPAACAPGVAVMPLAGPAVLVTALAPDALTLRRRLTSPIAVRAESTRAGLDQSAGQRVGVAGQRAASSLVSAGQATGSWPGIRR